MLIARFRGYHSICSEKDDTTLFGLWVGYFFSALLTSAAIESCCLLNYFSFAAETPSFFVQYPSLFTFIRIHAAEAITLHVYTCAI